MRQRKRKGMKYITDRCKNFLKKILYSTRLDIIYYYGKNYTSLPKLRKKYAKEFVNVLMEELHPKSVIDFGCGSGDFLAEFEKIGVKIRGLDASKAREKDLMFDKRQFIRHDLRDPYICDEHYDVCLCFEVAEHIQEKYSKQLVETLTLASETSVFTAAGPGQGGVSHVNLKPQAWWEELFKRKNFVYQSEITSKLKEKFRTIPNIHWWYVENLMIFKRERNYK